jgi:hypothetical protein
MDNYGQMVRYWVDNLWQKDNYGRLWTHGSALQNRRLQVRFLSHMPLANRELEGLLADGLVSRFHVFQANDAKCDANLHV